MTARDPLINNAWLTPSRLTETPVSRAPSEMAMEIETHGPDENKRIKGHKLDVI